MVGECVGWDREMLVEDSVCVGGGGGRRSHLVPVARAARVVPLSAVVFDGLSCVSSFYLKSEPPEAVI